MNSPQFQYQAQHQSQPYWQACSYPTHPMNMTPPHSPSPSSIQQSHHSSSSSSTPPCSYYGRPQHYVPQYYYYAPVFYKYPPSPAELHNQQQSYYHHHQQQHQQQHNRHRSPLNGHSSRRSPAAAGTPHHQQKPANHYRQRPSSASSRSRVPPSHSYVRPYESPPPSMAGRECPGNRPPLSRPQAMSTPRWESCSASVNFTSTTKPRRRPSLISESTATTVSEPASPHRESLAKRLLHRLTRSIKS